MADKKLLEESTIRRFMKLANINEKETSILSEVKSPVTGGHGQVSKGNKKFTAGEGKHKVHKKAHSVKEGYGEGMGYEEGMHGGYEEAMHEEEEMGGMDLGGDTGMEGGDDAKTKVESAIEVLKDALNDILDAVDSDKRVDSEEGGEGEEADMEEPSDEESGMEEPGGEEDFMAEAEEMEEDLEEEQKPGKKPAFLMKKGDKKGEKKDLEEELDESIELVDDDLIETLLNRVTARLVREAKGGSGGGSTSHKPKGNTYAPHKAGKGTGFSGSGKTLNHKGKHQASVKKH